MCWHEPARPYQPGDFVGRAGLERSFESTLRGVDGARREVVDARGQTIPHLQSLIDQEMVKPHAGNNLVLSIDMRLQEVAEKSFPGVAGAVVAIDVRTGFIKALVSRPAFDPNVLTGRVTASQMQALAKDPLQPMIFRPTAQHYSPGSTFKVITTLAALRSGQFHTHSTATCGGYTGSAAACGAATWNAATARWTPRWRSRSRATRGTTRWRTRWGSTPSPSPGPAPVTSPSRSWASG